MKTLRKVLIVVLALVAMFSFAMFTACDCAGKEGGTDQTQSGSTSQSGNNGGGNTKYEVIKFDKEEITMLVGDDTYVFAYSTSYSELPVTYTSKDPSIASVNSLGKVVAHRKGETKIVASSGGFEAECKVTVTHGNLQPSLNVYGLISESYVVPQGNTYALNYEVLFNGNKYDNVDLTVSTNNNNITATVVNNVVNITGNARGETELTVSASWDGVSGIPSMSKTVTVSVIGNVSLYVNNGATSEVVIANKTLQTYNGYTTSSAPFVVTASGTNNQPTIEIDDTSIATYSNGVITGTGMIGDTFATVSVTNEDGEEFSIVIPIICERAVGDYLVDGDFQVIDFNTNTGIINELNDIFGRVLEENELIEAFHGYDELFVENNKIVKGIQGQAFGEPEPIYVTLYTEFEGYRVLMKPYVFKGATEISTSYQYSCVDGLFFNEDFVLEDVVELLDGKLIKEAYVQTDGGQIELPISTDRKAVLGLDLDGAELANYYIAIASEDGMIYIGATAYSLIIDEMSDFSYFYIPDGTWSYDRSKRWTVTSGMDWDGYYVLANDLTYDPSVYTHKGYGSPFVYIGWSSNVTNANFASVGATQTEQHFSTYGLVGKGLTGIFDGRGHVIDGFQNATWTAKGDYVNSMVDNALATLSSVSESNQTTANNYKNKGISASNGGLFQIVNGAVIRNVGFTNTKLSMTSGVFSSMTLNGAQIENVFIHVDPAYSYNKTGRYGTILHGTVSASVVHRNVVVFNDTDKINERASGVFGQSASTYSNKADAWSNVYVVSGAPLYGSCYSGGNVIDPYAAYDSEYLNGVKQEVKAGVINSIAPNVRRYTTIDSFVADSANIAESIATFDTSIWTLLDGVVPVFKNSIKNKDIEFYVGDTKLSDAGNQIVNNQNTKITAKYLGATIAEVDSVTITSGNNIVSADGAVVSATGLGSATADISYTYNGQTITASANLEVVAVINPIIKANDAELVDETVNLILGQSTAISLFSGDTAVEDFELEILSGSCITFDGKTIKASGTAYGTAQVAINVNGGQYTFDVVVERPQVLANGIEIANFATVMEVDETSAITFKYNGAEVAGLALASSNTASVVVEGSTLKAVAQGESTITVSNDQGVSFTFNVFVTGGATLYAEELAYSAYDGVFFTKDLSRVVEYSEIFGGDVQILSAKDSAGNVYRVNDEGVVQGVETTNEKGEITLTLYSKDTAIKVNAETYTLVIDKAEDFEYFTITGNVGISETALTYDADDWYWNGYYVLANNIDASDYTHVSNTGTLAARHQTLDPELLAATNYGLSGVFDGQGYAVTNLYVKELNSQNGLGLFGYVNGGVIKNVSFENIYSGKYKPAGANQTYSNVIQAPFVNVLANGALIQDVYLGVYHMAGSSRYLLCAAADESSTIERVIVRDTYGADNFGTYGGYVIGSGTKATLKEVYVIANFPVITGGRVTVDIATDGVKAGKTLNKITADAAYVDGVVISETFNYLYYAGGHNESYNLADDTDNIEIYKASLDEKYEPYTISLLDGIKRYTSVEKMQADKAANDFSNWNANIWEINDGAPVFLSTLEVTAFINGLAIVEGATQSIVVGDELAVSLKLNGKDSTKVPTITVLEGENFVEIEGATIKAIANSNLTAVKVQISFNGNVWTQNVVIYNNITAEPHGGEFYFSAHDGQFYDAEFNVVGVDQIFGSDVDVIRAFDANGNALIVGENDQILNVDLGENDTWKATTLTLYTADKGLIINVQAADLIVDEAEDFTYFTLKGNVDVSGATLTYDAEDWYWDGYHVVVKDIDASNYAHASNTAENGMPTEARTLSAEKVAPTNYGFSGVFDGQGYTVTNFYIGTVGTNAQSGLGLFTYVNGGTIKNVAFENIYTSSSAPKGVLDHTNKYIGVVYAPFINTMVNDAKVQDVYLGYYRMSGTGRYMVCAVSDDTCSIERVLVKDNYGQSSFANLGGSVVGSASSATMTDVYVIDDVAVSIGGRFKATVTTKDESATVLVTNKWFNRIAADASIVDGVSIESSPYNYVFNSDDGKAYDLTSTEYSVYDDTNKLYPQPYTSINFLTGVKRYTSADKMAADVANNDFSKFNSDIWEIVNGVPTFVSTVSGEYVAYLNGEELTSSAKDVVVGDEFEVSIKAGSANITVVPTITILEGEDFVSFEGATIKATAYSNQTAVKVQIEYRNNVWTQEFVVYNDITATPYATELYFSAHDGMFYDNDFNIVTIDDIFGADVNVIRAFDANGELVLLGEDEQLLNVDLGANDTWKITSFTFYTVDAGYTVNVKAADLIIDEVEDLSYFQLKESATYISNVYKFAEGDFAWDGYYVLAKDVDGADYNGPGKKYAHDVENGMLVDADGAAAAIKEKGISEVEGHKTRGYMNSTGTEYIHGFMGTFDGNGHTISNITTDIEGLFGMVLGGTIKDVAFVNCVVATKTSIAYGIGGGATLENVYIETNDIVSNHSLSLSSNVVAKAFQTATISNVVVNAYYGSNDLDYILSNGSLKYYITAASIGLIDMEKTTASDVYVISILPVSMSKNIKSLEVNPDAWVITRDGAYVDGVANESSTAVAGIKRYTSINKMEEDKANNNFSSWNSDIWEVINGVPTFLSKVSGEYVATLNGVEVSENAMSIVAEDVLNASIKLGGKAVAGLPQVEVISGNEFITVTENTITAIAESGENEVKVSISYRGYTWTQSFVVYPNIIAESHGVEYYFSAHDGKFYNNEFAVVSVSEIFGADVEIVRAYDANGTMLTVGENNEILNLDLGKNDTWKATTLTLYTADAGKIITVNAADLIIDEAEDFTYFTLDGNVSFDEEGILTYDADDWYWDGYHVVVNDIDAGAYTHYSNSTNGTLHVDARAAAVSSIQPTNYGFSGVFDGQGYTIKNMYVDAVSNSIVTGTTDANSKAQQGLGLFTYVNNGVIKNVAFTNMYSGASKPSGASQTYAAVVRTPFINSIVNNSVIQDVYLSMYRLGATQRYFLCYSSDNTSSINRVFIQDNDITRANANYHGFVGPASYATMTDVYVIESVAILDSLRAYYDVVDSEGTALLTKTYLYEATADAEYVDSQPITSPYNYLFNVAASGKTYDVTSTEEIVYKNGTTTLVDPYEIRILTGVKRYTSLANMKTEEALALNDFTAWEATGFWTITNGVPSLHPIANA